MVSFDLESHYLLRLLMYYPVLHKISHTSYTLVSMFTLVTVFSLTYALRQRKQLSIELWTPWLLGVTLRMKADG
jgi:hypothetical protein